MKKKIIALAVSSVLISPFAMADAPTIYGKLDVNVGTVTDKGSRAADTASRIGVKANEDLGNGLKAVYKIEFDVDVAGTGTLAGRNQYLGLAGGFGTVLIGRHDSPLKVVQPTDTFNDGAADNSTIGMGLGNKSGEIRATNALVYVSPSFNGVTLLAAGTSPATGNDDRSILGGKHLAAMYGSTKKGLFLSAAMDSFSEAGYGLADDYSQTSFAAQYKTGGLTANAMLRQFDDGSATDVGTYFNLAYKMGKITVKGKLMQADVDGADKATQLAVGLAYSLGKYTTAYAYNTTKDKYFDTDVTDGRQTSSTNIVGFAHKF